MTMKILKVFLLLCCSTTALGKIRARLADGAKYAKPLEFPHMASIQVITFGKLAHWCGGALISRKHVLTAAHCFKHHKSVPFVHVEVGTTKIGAGQKYEIQSLIINKHYAPKGNRTYYPNDIGIVVLKAPVIESDSVQIIRLGTSSEPGDEVTLSGFGSSDYEGPLSPRLRKSTFRIVTNQECEDYYSTVFPKPEPMKILPFQLCAKGRKRHGSCKGDSGSPLIRNNEVVGIVSVGDTLCGAGNPDIYTRVSYFFPWIQKVMANNADEYDTLDPYFELINGPIAPRIPEYSLPAPIIEE